MTLNHLKIDSEGLNCNSYFVERILARFFGRLAEFSYPLQQSHWVQRIVPEARLFLEDVGDPQTL